ncbi:MAG: hypothetical protein IPL28_08385 [Chloroflexi bacterium]|nr:hypothetical protein [Chloroflexota bacterium]
MNMQAGSQRRFIISIENNESGSVSHGVSKMQISEAVPILVTLAKKGSQNRLQGSWKQSRIITALSLFEDHLSENVEVFKMELNNVPITRDLNYTRDVQPSIRAITILAPEEITGVLVDFQ